MSRCLYLHHPSSLEHDTGSHPECADRITAIESTLAAVQWLGWEREQAPAVARQALEAVHPSAYVDAIHAATQRGGALDVDTTVSPGSWQAALHAAGGAVAAVDALVAGDAAVTFSGLRPPGHHAEASRAMGFCLFNNLAVAAQHAITAHSIERVAVIDWDVHHGNGTESIFWDRGDVLYASIHQSPFYPGTGALADSGVAAGEGFTVNVPVPAGSGQEVFLAALEHLIEPILTEYDPGLVLVSTGYDAHRDDPLSQGGLEDGSFGLLAARVRRLANLLRVPFGFVLEGGYDLRALAASTVETLRGARGEIEMPESCGVVAPVERAIEHNRRWWGI